MFNTAITSAVTDDQCLNLQYSIQNDTVGLDWVLRGERNIEDKNALAKFVRHVGHKITKRRLNGVQYLRVEDGDIAGLGVRVVTEFYRLEHDAKLGLLADGFEYLHRPAVQQH